MASSGVKSGIRSDPRGGFEHPIRRRGDKSATVFETTANLADSPDSRNPNFWRNRDFLEDYVSWGPLPRLLRCPAAPVGRVICWKRRNSASEISHRPSTFSPNRPSAQNCCTRDRLSPRTFAAACRPIRLSNTTAMPSNLATLTPSVKSGKKTGRCSKASSDLGTSRLPPPARVLVNYPCHKLGDPGFEPGTPSLSS